MTAGRREILAFRLARQHLHERLPTGRTAEAAVAGLQDTPPGGAGVALAARMDGAAPADLGALVIVPSVRGAPLAVSPDDLAIFTAGLAPPDEEAARVLVQTAAKTLDGMGALEALDRVSAAVADALADGPLGRDAFHQALRERLPPELLWWCEGCQSRHVHPSLWRATGVRGVLSICGRDPRGGAIFARPPAAAPVDDPGGELARRFLYAYGPATPAGLAKWAGIAPAHAKALWRRAGGQEAVDADGRRGWVLAGDAAALADPPRASGARLLGGFDPLLAAPDRAVLAPAREVQRRLWTAWKPGAVLVEGELAGTWRASRTGARLVVTVQPLAEGLEAAGEALAAEAARLAAWRGAGRSELVLAA